MIHVKSDVSGIPDIRPELKEELLNILHDQFYSVTTVIDQFKSLGFIISRYRINKMRNYAGVVSFHGNSRKEEITVDKIKLKRRTLKALIALDIAYNSGMLEFFSTRKEEVVKTLLHNKGDFKKTANQFKITVSTLKTYYYYRPAKQAEKALLKAGITIKSIK